MSVTLKFHEGSSIDYNLERNIPTLQDGCISWNEYLRTVPYVIDAEWWYISKGRSYTVLTFENEAERTLFVLRWG